LFQKAVVLLTHFNDAIRSAEKAAGLHASYNGDPLHMEAAQNLFLTVRGMRDNMRKKIEGGDD
jgi:hypothetical protein